MSLFPILAGIGALCMSNPRRRKRRRNPRRRNPLSVKRSAEFQALGTYDVTLSDGRIVQIARDAGNTNWWHTNWWPTHHHNDTFLGFTKAEALAKVEDWVARRIARYPGEAAQNVRRANPHRRNPNANDFLGRDNHRAAFRPGIRVHMKKIPGATGTVQPIKEWLDINDDPRVWVPVKWDDVPGVSAYARGVVTVLNRAVLAKTKSNPRRRR
jgi:hypothetical protein